VVFRLLHQNFLVIFIHRCDANGAGYQHIRPASRVASLFRSRITVGGNVAEVDQERCSSCLTCVRTCPFHAPRIGKEGKAEVDVGTCQGCGMCASACPSKAIQVYSFRDDQIDAEIDAAMEVRQ